MAHEGTVHRGTLQVSDPDRNYYATHTVEADAALRQIELRIKSMKTTDKRFIGLSADAIVTIENADKLVEQGSYGDAVGLYSEVIAVSPTAYCYAKRGYANFEAGNFAAAILDFNRALDLKPDSPITLGTGRAPRKAVVI